MLKGFSLIIKRRKQLQFNRCKYNAGCKSSRIVHRIYLHVAVEQGTMQCVVIEGMTLLSCSQLEPVLSATRPNFVVRLLPIVYTRRIESTSLLASYANPAQLIYCVVLLSTPSNTSRKLDVQTKFVFNLLSLFRET